MMEFTIRISPSKCRSRQIILSGNTNAEIVKIRNADLENLATFFYGQCLHFVYDGARVHFIS